MDDKGVCVVNPVNTVMAWGSIWQGHLIINVEHAPRAIPPRDRGLGCISVIAIVVGFYSEVITSTPEGFIRCMVQGLAAGGWPVLQEAQRARGALLCQCAYPNSSYSSLVSVSVLLGWDGLGGTPNIPRAYWWSAILPAQTIRRAQHVRVTVVWWADRMCSCTDENMRTIFSILWVTQRDAVKGVLLTEGGLSRVLTELIPCTSQDSPEYILYIYSPECYIHSDHFQVVPAYDTELCVNQDWDFSVNWL